MSESGEHPTRTNMHFATIRTMRARIMELIDQNNAYRAQRDAQGERATLAETRLAQTRAILSRAYAEIERLGGNCMSVSRE